MYYDKINQQRISSLTPFVQIKAKAWLAECDKQGVWVLVTECYRSWLQQAIDWAIGRTKPGTIITHAPPGFSFHNYGVALDFVPADGQGKIHYDDMTRYIQAIEIAKKIGFESGNDWTADKRDTPHLQFTAGHDINWFRAGGRI